MVELHEAGTTERRRMARRELREKEVVALLKAIHINDSKNPFGAHKDRHEKIGEGFIGTDAIVRVMRHEALKELPFYLETPNELDGYEREIRMLKELVVRGE